MRAHRKEEPHVLLLVLLGCIQHLALHGPQAPHDVETVRLRRPLEQGRERLHSSGVG
jgi:hypothetical protein